MNWTSRERVIAAINHREPDRVPIDVQPGFDFYLALKEYLGLGIEESIQPSYFREVIPHPRVCEEMGWDVISIKLVKPESRQSGESEPSDNMVDAWGGSENGYFSPGAAVYGRLSSILYQMQNLKILNLIPGPTQICLESGKQPKLLLKVYLRTLTWRLSVVLEGQLLRQRLT